MTDQARVNKNQRITIVVLAILLVGLLAFNITTAFFTDKENRTDEFTFGTISLKAIDGDVIYGDFGEAEPRDIVPGDTLKGGFSIDLVDDSQDAYVRYRLTATPSYSYLFDTSTHVSSVLANDSAIVAYIDGELRQFYKDSEGTLSEYVDGAQVVIPAEELDALTAVVNSYKSFDRFVLTGGEAPTIYELSFELKQSGDDKYVETTLKTTTGTTESTVVWTLEGVTLGADNQELYDRNQRIEALLKDAKDNYERKLVIQAVATQITNGFGLDGAVLKSGYITAGDGWVYRVAPLKASDNAEVMDITYVLPKTIGNEMQKVKINLALAVEVVQAANVTDGELDANALTNEQLKQIYINNVTADAKTRDCVKQFYVAEDVNGIQEYKEATAS